MALPIALWVAAGLGAAGLKFYRDLKDVKKILKNAVARYDDEKYNFYQTQKELLPLVLLTGRFKLELWNEFGHFVDEVMKMENPPTRLKYKDFEDFHFGKPEWRALKKQTVIVNKLVDNGLTDLGTGLLTGLAFYGGTLTTKVDEDVKELPGFPVCEAGSTMLEALSTHTISIESTGNIEECAVLNSILSVPNLVPEFDIDSIKDDEKDKAMDLKDEIDQSSLDLADAVARMARTHLKFEILMEYFEKVKEEYEVGALKIFKILKTKKDFNKFTAEEQELFLYTAYLVKVARKLMKTDVLLKRGNINVLNTLELREIGDVIRKMYPEELMHAADIKAREESLEKSLHKK